MNNRRKLLIALGAGAVSFPLGSHAQQSGKVWHVGFLAVRHIDFLDSDYYYGPFRQGMRELGYVEGKNLVIEWRSAEGDVKRLQDLAAELVKLQVDVIVTNGTPATSATRKQSTTIPIVMGTSIDPIGDGFVASLAHPAGNITGLSNQAGDIGPKHLEMLIDIVPKLTRVTVLVNPTNSSHSTILKSIRVAGQKKHTVISAVEARTSKEIDNAFSTIVQQNAGALIVASDGFFNQQLRQIAELAAKHRLPSISAFGKYVEAGGLMSYGQDLGSNFKRAATYVDKILKGAKPGDLPVEQPTIYELFINGKTAKTLGLTIPQSLLISADKVIE